MNYYQFDMKEV